jgi:hypothetical protein
MCIGLYVKYPLLLSNFDETWIFFVDRVSKNTQISNLMKIRLMGPELFHVERRIDTAKPIVAFRNVVNTPNKCIKMLYTHRNNQPAN